MARSIIDPYINDIKENSPYMKRVDQDNAEIGSQKSNMPKTTPNLGTIKHVGDGVGGSR